MNFGENIGTGFSNLRANKLRSALTILAIIIGVMAIMGLWSILQGLQNNVEQQLAILGSNTFQVQKTPALQMGRLDRKYRNRKNVTVEHALAIRDKASAVKLVGPEDWQFGVTVKYEDKKTNPNVQLAGGTPEFAENNGYFVAEGRFITNNDVDRARRVIILGKDVVKKVFPYGNPLGKWVRVDADRYEVVGLLEEQGAIFGESQDNQVVIPLTTFQNVYGKNRSINITVQAWSADDMERAIEQTVAILRVERKVPPGEPNDFEIWSSKTFIDTFNNIARIIKMAAIGIVSIALIVAGIGIMNIMLVSIRERTREIGIRKAVGAKRRDILSQFLTEAVILCAAGGIIGIALGIGVAELLAATTPLRAAIPIVPAFLALLFSSAVGLFFGIYPATKAARLDPIESLRYE
ncbi:MAG: ABC transporter permease [Gemmatimonadota bacterium]|nr:MAG: ABC transporter permease [Gemmatimonadota bacterium]